MLRELPTCVAAARLSGVPEQDLPDIEQLGAMAAWRALEKGKVHTRDQARAFLWGVGRRLASNHRRAHARRPQCRDPHEIALGADLAPSAEDVLTEQAERALVEDALAALAVERPELALVVEAHDLEEVPMVEIAAEQRVPLGTAWNRRRLGWRDLRSLVARAQGGRA